MRASENKQVINKNLESWQLNSQKNQVSIRCGAEADRLGLARAAGSDTEPEARRRQESVRERCETRLANRCLLSQPPDPADIEKAPISC